MSIFSEIFDWFEERQLKKEWEEAGKPYYIRNPDGTFHRVSAYQYENYLLDNGYNPRSARAFMRDSAYDPELQPVKVISDPDRPDPPPADFFNDADRPDPPDHDFFGDPEF